MTFCSIGYLFGEIIKTKLNLIEHIEKYIIGALILLGLVISLVSKLRKKTSYNMKYSKSQGKR